MSAFSSFNASPGVTLPHYFEQKPPKTSIDVEIELNLRLLLEIFKVLWYNIAVKKWLRNEVLKRMKAVITVTGKDSKGIIAKVSTECTKYNANIIDVSQSVLKEYFAMIMLADISELTVPLGDFVDVMNSLAEENGLKIQTMHEDIFNTMHRI